MSAYTAPLTVREQRETLDLLDPISAHAYGILFKIDQVIAHVGEGSPVTMAVIDELISRVDCLRQSVEGCKVLYSDTVGCR